MGRSRSSNGLLKRQRGGGLQNLLIQIQQWSCAFTTPENAIANCLQMRGFILSRIPPRILRFYPDRGEAVVSGGQDLSAFP